MRISFNPDDGIIADNFETQCRLSCAIEKEKYERDALLQPVAFILKIDMTNDNCGSIIFIAL
jgi:hypothetical protein